MKCECAKTVKTRGAPKSSQDRNVAHFKLSAERLRTIDWSKRGDSGDVLGFLGATRHSKSFILLLFHLVVVFRLVVGLLFSCLLLMFFVSCRRDLLVLLTCRVNLVVIWSRALY